jgi:hypothetical protein
MEHNVFNIKKLEFSPHGVFMRYVWISRERTVHYTAFGTDIKKNLPVFSVTYEINLYIYIMEINFAFKGLIALRHINLLSTFSAFKLRSVFMLTE